MKVAKIWARLPLLGISSPELLELEACSNRIQTVKKAFLRRFWLSAGRQALRDVARQRLEEVWALSFGYVFFVCWSFSTCSDLQSKRACEAAKRIVSEGVDAGELAGTSGQAGSDDKEDPKV